jgi:hypothetical protein
MRLLEGIDHEEFDDNIVMLQAGNWPGAPLRGNASDDRFVVLGLMREFSHAFEEEAAHVEAAE